MDLRIIVLLVCSTSFTSGAVHEINVPKEANRTNRNIHIYQENNTDFIPEYQPPIFNYQIARQMASQYQDHQKQRYAQQQRMDMKNGLSMRIPITPTVQLARSQNLNQNQAEQTEDWQPFQPTPIPKTVTVQRKPKTIRLRTKSKRNKTKAINSGDSIKAAGSERIETKKQIDRQDIPDSDKIAGEVVYIPPSLLQQVLGNSEKARVLGDINSHEISRVDFSALSDLVGKNPNVQLEGLQRLLEETSGDAPVFPVIQGPQPFKTKDHTPIIEKTNDIPNPNTRPNIKVDHEQTPRVSTIIPTTPVAQNSLENIQKQLDEASKLDADDALARAREQAKAHVEAQHKAIEEAQKAIFEKVQKSFGNSQALPLVQINPQVLNQLSFSPTPSADDISAISNVPKLRVEKPATISVPLNPALDLTLTTHAPISEKLFSPEVSSIQEASISDLNGHPNKVSLNNFDNNAPLHQYPSKNVQYYAPNHIHQAATQLQAERTLMAQVKSQNEAILNSLQSPNTIVRHQTVSAQKRMRNKNIQKISSDVLEPTKYQQSHSETQPEKLKVVDSGSGKQLNGSDNIQYAANYAFGYRIKDVKEGNDFGHQEKRHGKSAQGKYYVLLPDGRKQHVEYYADDSGYHAKVSYENIAHHR